jgi:3-oxoacyl-[acyl-carrier protein] reductase
MELALRGKAALITASSRGIGRACVSALAREGVKVAVCARSVDAVSSLVQEFGGSACGHVGLALDLCAEGAPQQLAAFLAANFAPVDIVVHNLGGTLAVRDTFAEADAWRRVWRMNFEVALELNNLLVPPMRARGWGRIITISSLAAVEHQASAAYSVVKAALTAYTRVLGRELAATGVVPSVVVPGTVLTAGGSWDVRRNDDPAAVQRYVAERLPAGTFQSVEQIADTITFLASERASQFIGSPVFIDGGQGRSFPL